MDSGVVVDFTKVEILEVCKTIASFRGQEDKGNEILKVTDKN